jgi:D-arabinose 1-dehydrogenase-like Zn-dependent alcohol dehydrogenase
MKAAIYPGHGKPITIEDIPDPQPGPGDVGDVDRDRHPFARIC